MQLSSINPFMRYAELQATVKSSAPLSSSYDYRLFYVLGVDGDGKLVLKDSVVRLAKDSIIYLRPGTPYYFDGKVKEAAKMQLEMMDLVEKLFIEVNPIPVKNAMNMMGMDVGELKLPLVDLSEENAKKVRKALVDYGIKVIN